MNIDDNVATFAGNIDVLLSTQYTLLQIGYYIGSEYLISQAQGEIFNRFYDFATGIAEPQYLVSNTDYTSYYDRSYRGEHKTSGWSYKTKWHKVWINYQPGAVEWVYIFGGTVFLKYANDWAWALWAAAGTYISQATWLALIAAVALIIVAFVELNRSQRYDNDLQFAIVVERRLKYFYYPIIQFDMQKTGDLKIYFVLFAGLGAQVLYNALSRISNTWRRLYPLIP